MASSMASEGALHPRRIETAMAWLCDPDHTPSDVGSTCLAALRLVQKTQAAAGITPAVADGVAHVLSVLDYVKSGFKPK